MLVRRSAADSTARRSGPIAHDLPPWRSGHRHYRVQCSVARVAGWVLQQWGRPPNLAYSKADLRWHLRQDTSTAQAFRAQVSQVVEHTDPAVTVSLLNVRLLQLCRQLFPPSRAARARAGDMPAVKGGIRMMWEAHRRLRARRPGTSFLQIFAARKRYIAFQNAWRHLRAQSRQARRARLWCRPSRWHVGTICGVSIEWLIFSPPNAGMSLSVYVPRRVMS